MTGDSVQHPLDSVVSRVPNIYLDKDELSQQ
jgi:hypothetical protein